MPLSDSDPAWSELSTVHEGLISARWRMEGMKLNLANPCTLAEKIEWLKLNDHRDVHVQMADKLAAREYVLKHTGDIGVLNHLYGVYENADEIPVADLPERFVVRTSHWSGGNFICTDKKEFTLEVKRRLNGYMSRAYGLDKGEWPYWRITPKLLVEEYLEDAFGQLVDYKVFCFNGEPKFILVATERLSELGLRKLFFDTGWQLLPFVDCRYPAAPEGMDFPRPDSLPQMLRCSRLLSKDAEFVRVDFYDVFGELRFGELTLYPESGRDCRFLPEDWNRTAGDWLRLPQPNRNPRMAYFTEFPA